MHNLPESLQSHEHIVIGDTYYFPGMENQVYHQSAGISSSTLRRFKQSQLHAMQEVVEQTPAMAFGSAAHSLIVEGEDAFNNEVAVLTGSPYTASNKELKKEYESRGLTVIKQDDRDKIYAMNDALLDESKVYLNADAGEYPGAFDTPYENALYWYEKDTLLKLKGDVLRYPVVKPYADNAIVVVDYKTTADCSVRGFTSSIKKFQYDLQAAFYKRGFEKAGFTVQDFIFVAQEKKAPYASKIFKMSQEDMERGWLQLEHTLGEYSAVAMGKQQPSVYNSPSVVEVNLSD